MNRSDNKNPWQTLTSRIAYQGPYLTVREDSVITPGGTKGVYSVVESKPGVLVIAQNDSDEVYVIEAFKYPLQTWRWEIPGGGIDQGDTPLRAAQKELEEELGLHADRWDQLGDMYPSNNGPMNDHNLVFLARELHHVPKRHETGEAIQPAKALPWKSILAMIEEGELTDGQSLGALMHYMLWREKQKL
ncbi:MAG TPA: NUDIX hydrolase [Candidatus Saccharimonadales bacterium]|nr:NUDIX hydrolase [Candidatus Saccharimonadales bacterium]